MHKLSLRTPLTQISLVMLSLSLTLTGCNQSNKPAEQKTQQTDSTPSPTTDTSTTQEKINTLKSSETGEINTMIEPKVWRENVSQQFIGTNEIDLRLAEALPELPYSTTDLSEHAQKVNQASWQPDMPIDSITATKIQALLNWHQHGVGAVDGTFGKNVVKAMQAFQQARDLPITETMDSTTWQALTADSKLNNQPVLVNYTLTKEDVRLPHHPKGMQYKSVREAVAEKFHMSQTLLKTLNPNTPLKAGNTITVYNPGQPNMTAVAKVIADKRKNILYAYDANDKMIASYPTTVGGGRTPSPKGTHKVANRVLKPTYNKDFKNPRSVLPPGPNNPVGLVWMGLSKPGYGIHGSPQPEMISRQASAGCVRLTNWDALSLYGTMEMGATVEFR